MLRWFLRALGLRSGKTVDRYLLVQCEHCLSARAINLPYVAGTFERVTHRVVCRRCGHTTTIKKRGSRPAGTRPQGG